jgi:membrane protease subunit HflC
VNKWVYVIIAGVLVILFAAKSSTYQLSFTERAVVANFGKVSDNGVIDEPGLKFKAPAPFSSVTIYDTRVRQLNAVAEQFQLADNRQIIADVNVTWRVADPRTFYRRFNAGVAGRDPEQQYERAGEMLEGKLRSSLSAVSDYSLVDLFNPEQSKLPELEQRILDGINTSSGDDPLTAYGVEVGSVYITQVTLPEEVTRNVIQRMEAERTRIAADARSEGRASAEQIRKDAQAAAERILTFASLRASEIRTQGDKEATEFLAIQAEDPVLAEFLKRVDFISNGLATNITWIADQGLMGWDMFSSDYLREVVNHGEEMNGDADGEDGN